MTSQCLSEGETKVSCRSLGGDSPFQYSWSLDGVPRNSSDNDMSSTTLKQGESGNVVCNVSNNVSAASASQMISECGEKKSMILIVTVYGTVHELRVCFLHHSFR